MGKSVDIAIIGNGIAGMSALVSLRESRRSIVQIAPQQTRSQPESIGESLSPTANPVLKSLGIWDAFLDQKHSPSTINFSSWGSEDLIRRDFSDHPDGHGWCLNRRKFESLLDREANLTEHKKLPSRLIRATKSGNEWELTLGNGETVRADYVIDCSGRSAAFARNFSDRQRDRKLISVYAFLDQTDEEVEPTRAVLIEARENGWWYSSLTPNRKLVVCFFTDKACLPKGIRHDTQAWQRLAQSSEYTWKRIETAGYAIKEPPQITDASSRFLSLYATRHWAAAGDAAAAFDPLSSHGITTALWSGRKAGLAAVGALNNDPHPVEQYNTAFSEGLDHYRRELATFYLQERRFPDSTFWAARRSLPNHRTTLVAG